MVSKELSLPIIPGLEVTENDFRTAISYQHSYYRQNLSFMNMSKISSVEDKKLLRNWIFFKRNEALQRIRKNHY